MVYDVIIIGAGPAGLTCGLQLARAGKSCLILEQKEKLSGKVCGDGLSSHCMQVLKKINIHEADLIALGGKKIYRNITSNFGKLEQRYYSRSEEYENYAFGLSRDVFDSYLMNLVRKAGAEVKLGRKVCAVEKYNSEYIVDNMYKAKKVVLACGAIGANKFGAFEPNDLPVGISARIYGDCNLASDAFYFKYDWQYGEGYAWLFPVGEKLWNYGIWSADRRKDVKVLFSQLEERIKHTYFSGGGYYDRIPGGALIGATRKEVRSGKLPCIGDCRYLACFESGEGISFAVESGYHQAMAIIHDMKAETVRMPTPGAFCTEVSLLNREALIHNG
ncbi:MAG: NAD(P)/FAD-dependent oxidoreductase [Acutalibacteraceae bacterium]